MIEKGNVPWNKGLKLPYNPHPGQKGKLAGEKHPGYGKHLSEETRSKISLAKRGRAPWNKGLRIIDDVRIAKFHEAGQKALKGKPNWKKGKIIRARSMWRDNNKYYKYIHKWVGDNLGKASLCSSCFAKEDIEWANVSREYKKDQNDWVQLCVKCHAKFDALES